MPFNVSGANRAWAAEGFLFQRGVNSSEPKPSG